MYCILLKIYFWIIIAQFRLHEYALDLLKRNRNGLNLEAGICSMITSACDVQFAQDFTITINLRFRRYSEQYFD